MKHRIGGATQLCVHVPLRPGLVAAMDLKTLPKPKVATPRKRPNWSARIMELLEQRRGWVQSTEIRETIGLVGGTIDAMISPFLEEGLVVTRFVRHFPERISLEVNTAAHPLPMSVAPVHTRRKEYCLAEFAGPQGYTSPFDVLKTKG